MAQLHLIGTLAEVQRENVSPPEGDPFVSVTLVVRSPEGSSSYARLAKGFPEASLPEVGQPVTLGVWPRPYINKKHDRIDCGWTAHSLIRESVNA